MENKSTILFGGELMNVTKLDGTMEEVQVRILPVKEFQRLAAHLEDELKVIEIYCNKQDGWAESLTRESYEAVILKGNEFNEDFFVRWARRRLAQREKMSPGITERLASLLANGSANSQSKSE